MLAVEDFPQNLGPKPDKGQYSLLISDIFRSISGLSLCRSPQFISCTRSLIAKITRIYQAAKLPTAINLTLYGFRYGIVSHFLRVYPESPSNLPGYLSASKSLRRLDCWRMKVSCFALGHLITEFVMSNQHHTQSEH